MTHRVRARYEGDAFLAHGAASASVLLLTLSASVSFLSFSRPIGIGGPAFSALLITLIWACFGFGAVIARHSTLWARRGPALIGAAVFSLLAAGLLLAGHMRTASGAAFGIAAAAAMVLSMALYGSVAANALRGALAIGRAFGCRVVAAASVGAVLGFVAAFFAVQSIGVHVALLGLAGVVIASALRPLLGPLAAALAIAVLTPYLPGIEARFEDLRAAPYRRADIPKRPRLKNLFGWQRTMLYWGGSGKFEEFVDGNKVRLFYNNCYMMGYERGQYGLIDTSNRHYFVDVRDGDRALFIGVSDAIYLNNLVRRKKVALTLVEINDAVVRAYRENPERNQGVYLHSRVFARDGRSVLEASSANSYDLVVYDFADSESMIFGAANQHLSLGTREGLAALDRALSPDGKVVFMSLDKPQVLMFAGGLRDRGWSVLAYSFPKYVGRVFFGFPQGYAVVARRSAVNPLSAPNWSEAKIISSADFLKPLSDNGGLGISGSVIQSRYGLPQNIWLREWSIFAVFAVLALLLTAAIMAPSVRGIRHDELFFLRIGAGWMLVQLMVLQLLKPLLGETLLTTLAVNVGLGVFSAIGSLVTSRLHSFARAAKSLPVVMAAALAVSWFLLKSLRLTNSDMSIPWLELLGATAPIGLAVGLFFPLGLSFFHPKDKDIGGILVADAVGALGGYSLFRIVFLQYGVSALPWICAAIYGCACWGLQRAALLKPEPSEELVSTSSCRAE
jgi:hypothetical protein